MPSTINNNDLFLVVRGGANYKVTAADVAAYTGGGGGGGVTSIAVTAPINDTGTATVPNIGIDPATTTLPGSIQIATLAEAATGTLATSALTPETGVPKNASGMTGAAILPGGTTGQQPGGASDGWFRYNSTLKVLEYYANSAWLPLVFGGGTTGGVSVQAAAAAPATRPNGAPLQGGDIYYNTTDKTLYTYDGANWIPEVSGGVNIQTSATAPTTRSNGLTLVGGDLYYNTATKQYFSWDGTTWVPFDQRNVVVTAVDATVKANDYVVVTASGKKITLPATPAAGTCVTVVVAGTFLDTVVARGAAGDNIMALNQDITLDKQYAAMQFTYTDATNGWRLN